MKFTVYLAQTLQKKILKLVKEYLGHIIQKIISGIFGLIIFKLFICQNQVPYCKTLINKKKPQNWLLLQVLLRINCQHQSETFVSSCYANEQI